MAWDKAITLGGGEETITLRVVPLGLEAVYKQSMLTSLSRNTEGKDEECNIFIVGHAIERKKEKNKYLFGKPKRMASRRYRNRYTFFFFFG